MASNNWVKRNETDKIWWEYNPEIIGRWVFSFDKKKAYEMYMDYPHNLTKEEKEIFDKENPYWKEYFSHRK